MIKVLTTKPKLDEDDFKTIRELYSQAQNWTRHYESLIVTTNVFLVSSSMIFVGLAFRDEKNFPVGSFFLFIPVLMSVVGFVLTQTLFNLYAKCIQRLIRFENLLNCFDKSKLEGIDEVGSILESYLTTITKPPTVKFFFILHFVLTVIYISSMFLIMNR